MKKIIITALSLGITFISAQKKEIEKAISLIDSQKYTEVANQISAAEQILNDKLYLLAPEVLEKYYFAKGLSQMNAGQTKEGLSWLSKIADLGKEKIFVGKNENKEKVYFVGKSQADKNGANLSLKETNYTPELTNAVKSAISPMAQKINQEALAAYNSKNYKVAGAKFEELYLMLNTIGSGDQMYNYYAAMAYSQANMYDEAIEIYQSLIASHYTGVKTEYIAKNKKSGQEESLDRATFEIMKKANTDYTDFKETQTPSVEREIYDVLAEVLIRKENYKEAISVIEKGLVRFPDDAKLIEKKGTAYYKSGNNDKFIENLKQQIAKNPNDAVNYYNLGVLQSNNPKTIGEAEVSFKKALEINPNDKKALQAIFYNVYMGDDTKIIDEANAARKAGKMQVFDKIIAERKIRFAKGLPYLEKWYSLDSSNKDLVGTLKSIYRSLGKKDKEAEMTKIEAGLK